MVEKVNKRALEALIRSGALDEIGLRGNRLSPCGNACGHGSSSKMAEQQARDASSGMADLFGGAMVESKQQNPYDSFLNTKTLTVRERLGGEKDTLGLFLQGTRSMSMKMS